MFHIRKETNTNKKIQILLTRLEIHHLCDKAIICDGELGEFQFVESMDVLLTIRPVIHNVFRRVTIWGGRKKEQDI